MNDKLIHLWRTGAVWRAAMEALRQKHDPLVRDVGVKKDNDKVRMELVPLEAEVELAQLYTAGAVKYSPNGWRQGMEYSRLIGALKRHLALYESGSLIDPETGCHHGAAIMWYGAALVTYDKTAGMPEMWNDLWHWQSTIAALRAPPPPPTQDEAPEFVPGLPTMDKGEQHG